MNKQLLVILFFLWSFNVSAQNNDEIMTPIQQLFNAMKTHDSNKLLNQFTEGAILERASQDNTVKVTDLTKFAEFVGQSSKDLDEQIFAIRIHQSGNLASVWTPFAFYLDGKLSHCGVNSFQLIKQQAQWKIRYLIDNAYQGNCQQFIAEHKNEKTSS